MLVDSHCHLADPAFDADREAVIARAGAGGVGHVVVIGETPERAEQARAFAERTPGLSATAGLHPHEASRWNPEMGQWLAQALNHPAVVAVGETGLDFHYDHSPREDQRDAFAEHLGLAIARDLPVVVHSREADEDTLDLIEASGIAAERVVLHSFSGSVAMLERAIEAGAYVSFSGMVTFRTFPAETLVARVPADRLLAEADAEERRLRLGGGVDQLEADAGLVGVAGTGREHDALRMLRHGLADADLVVAPDFHLGAELAQEVEEVVGEAVVVIDQEVHRSGPRSAASAAVDTAAAAL